MFFVFYLFIQETVDIMTDNGGMNWVSFVTVVFTCVIGFVLTQNAPKIAQTLMTGQPQLSMGELVTAAGSLAMGTFKGVKAAGHIIKEGSRKSCTGSCKCSWNCSQDEQRKKSRLKFCKRPWSKRRSAENGRCKGNVCRSLNRFERQSPQCRKQLPPRRRKSRTRRTWRRSSGTPAQRTEYIPRTRTRRFKNLEQHFKSDLQRATKFDTANQSNVNMTRKEF